MRLKKQQIRQGADWPGKAGQGREGVEVKTDWGGAQEGNRVQTKTHKTTNPDGTESRP